MQISKEQWEQLDELASALYSADKYNSTIDGFHAYSVIREIIGDDYKE